MNNFTKNILLVLLLAGQALYAQDKKIRQIDSLLTALADRHVFNGSVLVAENGKAIYKRSIGYADRARHIPNSDTSHFNLASLSKPFTAIAVLELVQKGKLKTEDAVIKYFPDFPYPDIRIRHLLTQTSGLPVLERYEDEYINSHPDEIISNTSAYTRLIELKRPLYFKPGEEWAYNNTNYVLLAMLVEKISRMPFAVYMQKNIFQPAGMKESFIRTAQMPNTSRYMFASMYTTTRQNVDSLDHTRNNTYYNLGGMQGPGNVVSTLEDLLLFDNALAAGKLIGPALLDSAFKPVTLNNGKVFLMQGSTRSYAMGWNPYTLKTAPFTKFVFHDGHIAGLTTFLHRNLEKSQTIIFYDNMDDNPIQPMVSISNILNGLPPLKIRTTQSLTRVYGEAMVTKGIDYATVKFNTLKSDTAHYYTDENEMNTLGFDLLKASFSQHNTYALEVFKLNTLLYPKSGNTYDSYAYALAKIDKKEEAIEMYRKSIAIWPGNTEGKKALQLLLPGNKD